MGRNVPLALCAAVLVAAGLTGCRLGSVRDEDVTLAGVRDAVVVSGSTERTAAEGETLGKGDRVRTGRVGAAALVVRGRRVLLAASTEVVVPDGATVDLARGALLVDRRRGPEVTVKAGDTTVDRIGEGAVRVERRYSVLVAALSAGTRVRTASGQRLELDELYQVAVAGRALPRDAAPLQLRHDGWEREVIAPMLADDTRLNALAAGLDGPGGPVIPAAYRPVAGTRASEVVLAEAIGRAAGTDGRRARELRAQGGSWGVVAALAGTTSVDVGASLAAVLRGEPAPPSASPSQGGVVAGPSPEPISQPSPTRGGSGSPSPSRSPEPGRPTTRPPVGPTSPTPTTSPTQSLEDVIGEVIPTPSLDVELPLLR